MHKLAEEAQVTRPRMPARAGRLVALTGPVARRARGDGAAGVGRSALRA